MHKCNTEPLFNATVKYKNTMRMLFCDMLYMLIMHVVNTREYVIYVTSCCLCLLDHRCS